MLPSFLRWPLRGRMQFLRLMQLCLLLLWRPKMMGLWCRAPLRLKNRVSIIQGLKVPVKPQHQLRRVAVIAWSLHQQLPPLSLLRVPQNPRIAPARPPGLAAYWCSMMMVMMGFYLGICFSKSVNYEACEDIYIYMHYIYIYIKELHNLMWIHHYICGLVYDPWYVFFLHAYQYADYIFIIINRIYIYIHIYIYILKL